MKMKRWEKTTKEIDKSVNKQCNLLYFKLRLCMDETE